MFLNIYLRLQFVRFFINHLLAQIYKEYDLPNGYGSYNPFVSIIIPARNEAVGIGKSMESVLHSKYRNFELIVIDDGSTDETYSEICRVAEYYHPRWIKIIKNDVNKGKFASMNSAVSQAKGEIIVTMDADSFMMSDALGNMVKNFFNPDVGGVTGNIIIDPSNNLVSLLQFLEFQFGVNDLKTKSLLDSIYILPGASSAFRKKLFDKVGGFRGDTKTEDTEFTLRLREIGCKIVHADNAVCVVESAPEIKSLIKQRVRWIHGNLLSLLKHKSLLFSWKGKSKIFSWYEFPMIIVSYIDLFLLPVIFVLTMAKFIQIGDIGAFLLAYLTIPIASLFVIDFSRIKKSLLCVLTLPILFQLMNLINGYALIVAIFKFLTASDVEWQIWDRKGLSSV